MKKLITAILAAACTLTSIVSVSAITSSDKPITGGNTVFTQKEFMYTGEPTAKSEWSNAFCNLDWTGCRWTAETVDGKEVIKVVSVAGKTANYMDFNYYQYNNDKYYPSLDCSKYKYMKISFKLNDVAAGNFESQFWASSDSTELGKTRSTGTVSYKVSAEANKWTTVVVNLSDMKFNGNGDTNKPWSELTIRQFRLYPFGKAAAKTGSECFIEYLAFFETEAEANAYTGPKAATTTTATTTTTTTTKPTTSVTTAPKTADVVSITVASAVLSLGLAAVVIKKRAK